MKKSIKNGIIIVLGLLLILTSLSPLFAVYADQKQIDNLKEEVKKREEELEKIKDQKSSIKTDLDEELKKLETYRQEIKEIESEVNIINFEIKLIEKEIQQTEAKIKEREYKIQETEDKVKSYIKNSQSNLRVNSLFEFLMGSEDFSTMLLRLDGMNAIKRYNEDLIRGLAEEKAALEEDKAQLDVKKEELKAKEKVLSVELEKIKVYEERIVEVVKELRAKEAELEKQIQEVNHKNSADEKKIKEIAAEIERKKREAEEAAKKEAEAETGGQGNGAPRPPANTGGFGTPVPYGSYDVTASVWRYPAMYGGGPHMGVDLGINRGQPAYAVANGIVVATQSGCGEGYSYCGGGYGNYVSYIVNVGGHNYGILYAHLSYVSVSPMTPVVQGQTLGATGNTGLSTGPHIHIETIDMGPGSLADAWARWDGSYNFGTGPAAFGGRRCDQGYGFPCRLHPQVTLGLY